MPTLEQYQAFVAAVDAGSFSAASRELNKAQSAVSTAISNLEIDIGVELFDRSRRNPVLTSAGSALLEHARYVLRSNSDFVSRAAFLGEGAETRLCIAIEQGIVFKPLLEILTDLSQRVPFVEIELLEPGRSEVGELLRRGRADLGIMLQQEEYPQGFSYRGIGYSRLLPVCGRTHPLARLSEVSHADLRRYRQLITRSRTEQDTSHLREQKSPAVWYSESPYMIVELVASGLGWAVLPQYVVKEKLERADIVKLNYSFQQSDILQGVDLVWTEKRGIGSVGRRLMNMLLELKPETWTG